MRTSIGARGRGRARQRGGYGSCGLAKVLVAWDAARDTAWLRALFELLELRALLELLELLEFAGCAASTLREDGRESVSRAARGAGRSTSSRCCTSREVACTLRSMSAASTFGRRTGRVSGIRS